MFQDYSHLQINRARVSFSPSTYPGAPLNILNFKTIDLWSANTRALWMIFTADGTWDELSKAPAAFGLEEAQVKNCLRVILVPANGIEWYV
jgi:hypothetical protein